MDKNIIDNTNDLNELWQHHDLCWEKWMYEEAAERGYNREAASKWQDLMYYAKRKIETLEKAKQDNDHAKQMFNAIGGAI